jgi:four helix bundle protein
MEDRVSKLIYAKSHRDLVVYQKAQMLAQQVFQLTRGFSKEELFSLTDQIRRSSRSVGAQIAEAWAKRRYEKHFISKLTDADGEQLETQHWLETAAACGYLPPQECARLVESSSEVGRLLQGIIDKAEIFCGAPAHSISEAQAEYFIEPA